MSETNSGGNSRGSSNDFWDCLLDGLYKVVKGILALGTIYGIAKCVGIPTSNEEIQSQVAKEFKF